MRLMVTFKNKRAVIKLITLKQIQWFIKADIKFVDPISDSRFSAISVSLPCRIDISSEQQVFSGSEHPSSFCLRSLNGVSVFVLSGPAERASPRQTLRAGAQASTVRQMTRLEKKDPQRPLGSDMNGHVTSRDSSSCEIFYFDMTESRNSTTPWEFLPDASTGNHAVCCR